MQLYYLYYRIINSLVAALIVGVAFLVSAGNAFSQSLVINDCQGFTRAIKNVDPGSSNKVEIEVTDAGAPAQGVEGTLTNAVTGEVTAASAKSGLLVFENMSSGTYLLNIGSSSVKAGVIFIGPMGAGPGLATSVGIITGVVGGGAAVGVGVAIDDELDNSGSGSGNPPTGNFPEPQPTEEPSPGPLPTPGPTPIPTPDPFPCDPDEEPPPLDGFF